MRVVFLIPAYMAMKDNGGCATTPEPGILAGPQIQKILVGNTVKAVKDDRHALVRRDGSMRGLNIPNGATAGHWKINARNELCATWKTTEGPVENCNTVRYVGKQKYSWGGQEFMVIKGNPKNL